MRKLYKLILISLILFPSIAFSREMLQIDPLFEYPVAPEEIESLNEKCNYLVKNFWNDFNFKTESPLDQYALNDAFQVYSSTFRFADKKDVEQSVDKLLEKLSKNPLLLQQFMKAAEENLYGPRADFWSDDVYIKFLEAVLKNKKISENRKSKYSKQYQSIKSSLTGNTAPTFSFIDMNGEEKNYFPMSTPTILIFGNPDDTDWRLSRLKLESNFSLSDNLTKGKINILYIIPFNEDNWKEMISNYNKYWTLGTSSEVSAKYDLRLNPSIYVVGSDGKIILKTNSTEEASDASLNLIN